MPVESVVPTSRDEECPRGSTFAIQIDIGFVSLESETASGGERDDRRSEHDNPVAAVSGTSTSSRPSSRCDIGEGLGAVEELGAGGFAIRR
jgi:hypothetical protein